MAELEQGKVDFGEAIETPENEAHIQPGWSVLPPNRPRKVYSGMWGPPEIGAVAVGSLAVLIAAFAYFFWVVPSNRELVRNRAEADRLESELIAAKAKYGEITNTETQVGAIVASIDDFESRFLPIPTNGQAALYQRLNGLIHAYGLTNTTGPDYAPLETIDVNTGEQTQAEKGRSKYRSLYPGVYVSTTLEGSYQNIRRFIREIETGREFVIVSSVELAPAESDNRRGNDRPRNQNSVSAVSADPTGLVDPKTIQDTPGTATATGNTPDRKDKGKTHGETVSLNIELAAYFRRPTAPATAQR